MHILDRTARYYPREKVTRSAQQSHNHLYAAHMLLHIILGKFRWFEISLFCPIPPTDSLTHGPQCTTPTGYPPTDLMGRSMLKHLADDQWHSVHRRTWPGQQPSTVAVSPSHRAGLLPPHLKGVHCETFSPARISSFFAAAGSRSTREATGTPSRSLVSPVAVHAATPPRGAVLQR